MPREIRRGQGYSMVNPELQGRIFDLVGLQTFIVATMNEAKFKFLVVRLRTNEALLEAARSVDLVVRTSRPMRIKPAGS